MVPPPPGLSFDFMKRFITTSSRGLVEIRCGVNSVQFIHETVREFLVEQRRMQVLDSALGFNLVGLSHDRLFNCCLYYLRRAPRELPMALTDGCRSWPRNYPFLDYAYAALFYHLQKANLGGISQRTHLIELQHEPSVLRVLERRPSYSDDFLSAQDPITLLQLACQWSSPELIKLILDDLSVDVNLRNGYYCTALQAACASKEPFECVTTLLEAGAEANTQGGYYGNALQAACATGADLRTVEVLLDAGAEVNSRGGYYGSALKAAYK